jgi:TonB family protein
VRLIQVPAPAGASRPLVFEGDHTPHYKVTAGYLQLDAGSGWLRVPDIHVGLDLRVQIRLVDPQSDAVLELLGWRNGRVRIRLAERQLKVKDFVRPEGVRLRREYEAPQIPAPVGRWRALHVVAKERSLSIAVDGTEIGRYAIEEFVGTAILRAGKGGVQIRDAEWRATTVPDPTFVSEARRLKAEKPPNLQPAQIGTHRNPPYTLGAMKRRVTGIVVVEVVLSDDGVVLGTTVTKSLDVELDREAVDAVRKWRFVPARLDGQPVGSIAEIELTFALR